MLICRRMKKQLLACLAATLALTVHAVAATASVETINNLNAAFQGESNASARYQAFAQKADAEGLAQVAKLFRAASAAEAIHRDTHKATILKLGGQVAAVTLDAVTPGTTAENLQAAIKGESYERDTMYPAFLQKAKADGAEAAVRSFHFAVSAEKEHAKLYADALAQLGKNPVVDYYVCPTCGDTVAGRPTKEKCGTCRGATEKFIAIS
jgi:rubrerythrin